MSMAACSAPRFAGVARGGVGWAGRGGEAAFRVGDDRVGTPGADETGPRHFEQRATE